MTVATATLEPVIGKRYLYTFSFWPHMLADKPISERFIVDVRAIVDGNRIVLRAHRAIDEYALVSMDVWQAMVEQGVIVAEDEDG